MPSDREARDTDHEYPPGEWTVDQVAEALESATRGSATGATRSRLPTYEDRASWRALASEAPTRSVVRAISEAADRARAEPMPVPSASGFLDYERRGDRADYEAAYFRFRRHLAVFALAECVEREGRYRDAILDYAWRLCEDTTWLVPAHLPEAEQRDGLARPAEGEDHRVALFSARTALLLADLDRLLGDRLHPALRARLREEVDRRVLTPFANTVDEKWGRPPTDNWNAVCNAGAAIAALRLEEDTDRLARIVTKAAHGLTHYLANFGSGGCTPEGVTYWNFGFGHYLLFAAALDARTDGALSLLSPPVVPEIARFPLRVELGPGRFVPFSDMHEREGYAPHAACYAGLALDVPVLARRGLGALGARSGAFGDHTGGLSALWRSLAWAGRAADHDLDAAASSEGVTTTPGTAPPRRIFFPGHAWWVARAAPTDPEGVVVAAKGGHNGEPHNHNDCGSVVVHARGESLLTDPGGPTYDRDYFGPERYEYLAARSLGHSVPRIDGHEQRAGSEFGARVIDREATDERDALTLGLEGCYPDAAGLDTLRRTVALDRSAVNGSDDAGRTDGGPVTIRDEVSFADRERSWESLFVSYHPIEAVGNGDEGFVVRGDRGRATIEVAAPEGAICRVERLPDAVATSGQDAFGDARDVWRARVAVPAAARSTVELRVSPEAC